MAGDDGTASHVSFRTLKLNNFRSYGSFRLDLAPGIVVITGENGAGKTNLLEALSLFSPGRGLRRARLSAMEREGSSGGFSVFAELEGPEGEFSIGTGTVSENGAGEASRKIRINGSPAKSSNDLLEWLRVVWLTPAMDGLFTGPASDRRRFVDRMVHAIDPGHAQRTVAYEKAMRNRNRLLTDSIRDEAWFDAIEHEMCESGVAIAAARMEFLSVMQAELDRQDEDSLFPRALLALEGSLEAQAGSTPSVELEAAFGKTLREGRHRDRAAGRTLDGPHRSDLLVRHGPKDMAAALCSTGEQKALLTGLVLSHARLTTRLSGMAPILLLDEIAAHLDPGRRAALFDLIEEMDCQAFMTGTEPAPFSALQGRASFIRIGDAAG